MLLRTRIAPLLLGFVTSLTSLGLAGVACGGEPPKPPIAPKPPQPAGPFSKISLPRNAHVVWAVYKETWSVKPLKPTGEEYDEGPADDGAGKMLLRARDLVLLTTLRPDGKGLVTVPGDPALGVTAQGSTLFLHRAHAILYAPGFTTLAWDSHDYADTPKPEANPPLTKEMSKTPAGCEAVTLVEELFRDFPSGRDTGLPPAEFARNVLPILGDALEMIMDGMPDPAPASEDPKESCDGAGSKVQALHAKLGALEGWVASLPAESEKEGAAPPAPPSPVVLRSDATRWHSVIELWARHGSSSAGPIVHALSYGEPAGRKPAILAAWGIHAYDAMPSILKVLTTKDASDRAWAMWTLDSMGTPGSDACPVLVDLLREDDDKLRGFVIGTLGRMGPSARNAAVPLGKLLTDPDKKLRKAAFDALAAMRTEAQPAAPALVAALSSSDVEDKRQALRVFGEMHAAAKDSVPAIAAALKDSDVSIRVGACETLRLIGKDAVAAVPALGDAVADSDATVRARALNTLAALGPEALPALDKAKPALKDPDSNVRASAAYAIGAMGPKASSAVPMLADLLKADASGGTASANAARALGAMGPASKPALPTMLAVLKDTPDSSLRRALVEAVIDVGPPAAPEIPKLLAASEEYGSWYVQTQLARMGEKMGKAAVPQLGKLLSDKRDYVRRGALGALGRIGKDAASEVPSINKLLKEDGIRYAALGALEGIGPGAASSVEPLIELVDKNQDRWQALRTLSKIGTPSVAPLTKMMLDKKKDKYLRQQLPRAVLECGPGAAKSTLSVLETIEELSTWDTWTVQSFRTVGKAAVQPLQAALKDSRPGIRHKATLALGYLPSDAAKDAIPVLLSAMKASDTKQPAMNGIQRYGKSTAQPILQKILEDKTKADLHEPAKEVMAKNGW